MRNASLGFTVALLWTMHAHAAVSVDVPYQQFVLPNGLTLIVHEDHTAPLVAVNMWYHVGSKNEKAGQTGFAHLYEHLMFNGSAHFNDEYFRPFETAGATDMNGTTSNDRTNYFATVPKPALDMALWMESDRMANLLPAIDQAKLDEQRGVVQNEKRQHEDRPFGRVSERVAINTYPVGHPYSWEVIGSMRDLDAAALDDVHAWFKQYYGPNNATLVIAGDVDPAQVKQRVEFYFGAIPANPPLQQAQRWIAKRDEERRDTMQDRVPNARIYLVWNTPPFADSISNKLDLIGDILAGDASGVLTRQLVQKEKLATSISAAEYAREIAGQFWISADVTPGVDPLKLEQRIRALLREYKRAGPTPDALAQAKINYRAQFLRSLEKLGGFGGKSDVLATGAVLANDPAYYQKMLADVAQSNAGELRTIAQRWLDDGVYVLHVMPYPTFNTGADRVDRSHVPDAGPAPQPVLPAIERATLPNGLQLVLMRRADLPLIEMELQLPIGFYVDGWANAGTTKFALNMLAKSNGEMDSAAIAAKIRSLGADIDTYARLDSAGIKLSALTEKIDASTALFAQLIEHPTFSVDAITQLQQQTLATIQREKNDGGGLLQRVLPRLLLGIDHPDAGPLTGSGRADVIANLSQQKLIEFHRRWFNPAQATLMAVGDLDMSRFKQLAQKHFGAWPRNTADTLPPLSTPETTHQPSSIYLIDLPGSGQATIAAATVVPSNAQLNMPALTLANAALGAEFTSRLNMNLREDKHWSYGTRSTLIESRGPQLWLASGGVQIDKAGPALNEIRREWQQFGSDKPLTAIELDKVRTQRIRQLPGTYETNGALLQALAKNIRLQRADNYLSEESALLQKLDLTTVQQQAHVLDIERAVWLVIGDRQKILPQLKLLNWGHIVELDRDGNPL